MKVLNLYAGIGGNRKNWTDCEVTAVEKNEAIAAVYQQLYPHDLLVVGDAHKYLLDHMDNFDFIWTSPPCQSHSKMQPINDKRHGCRRYADLSLYQEIILLKHFFKGLWVVENVDPYYTELIPARKVGRHLMWSNFKIGNFHVEQPDNFINLDGDAGREKLMDWLGIRYEGKLYSGSHSLSQVLRNCVHPDVGEYVLNCARGVVKVSQPSLFT